MLRRTDLPMILLAVAASACAQSTATGTAQGSVTDDTGSPVPAVSVSYRRIPKFVGPATRPALAAGETFAQGVVVSNASGAYSLGAVPVGNYILCAQASSGAYLDPCRWQAAVPLTITNTAVASQNVVVTRGVFLNVQINDPGGVLPKPNGGLLQAGDFIVGVKFGNGAYLGTESVTLGTTGRSYQMPVPTGTPLSLWLFSSSIAIKDANGKSLSLSGAVVPFEAVAGQSQNFTFTVAAVHPLR